MAQTNKKYMPQINTKKITHPRTKKNVDLYGCVFCFVLMLNYHHDTANDDHWKFNPVLWCNELHIYSIFI